MTTPYRKLLIIVLLTLVTAVLLSPIRAQATASADMCSATLEKLWADASSACIGKPSGYVCNGGAAPAAEPSGLVANALASVGALVEVSTVKAIRTPPISADSIGIAWLRLPDPLTVTILVIGDVTMFDVTPADFSPWTSSIVQANAALPGCASAPRSVVILQSSGLAQMAVNSSSLSFRGPVLVSTDDANTIFIGIDGQATVLAQGQTQTLLPGAQVNVPHPPGMPRVHPRRSGWRRPMAEQVASTVRVSAAPPRPPDPAFGLCAALGAGAARYFVSQSSAGAAARPPAGLTTARLCQHPGRG